MIVILAVTIPVILVPVAFIWYLNVSGIRAVWNKTHEKKASYSPERVA